MTEAVKRQIDEAKKSLAKNTKPASGTTTPGAGRSASQPSRKPKPDPEPEPEEQEQEAEPQPQDAPTPRYYTSTSRTPNGHLMARLVGYTEAQLAEVYAFTQRAHGARPY